MGLFNFKKKKSDVSSLDDLPPIPSFDEKDGDSSSSLDVSTQPIQNQEAVQSDTHPEIPDDLPPLDTIQKNVEDGPVNELSQEPVSSLPEDDALAVDEQDSSSFQNDLPETEIETEINISQNQENDVDPAFNEVDNNDADVEVPVSSQESKDSLFSSERSVPSEPSFFEAPAPSKEKHVSRLADDELFIEKQSYVDILHTLEVIDKKLDEELLFAKASIDNQADLVQKIIDQQLNVQAKLLEIEEYFER